MHKHGGKGSSLNQFGFTRVVTETKDNVKQAREEMTSAEVARSECIVINIDRENRPYFPDKST